MRGFGPSASRGVRASLTATVCAALLTSVAPLPPAAAEQGEVPTEPLTVSVAPEAGGAAVTLDAALYRPSGAGPHPAVVLAHGFGGSRQDLEASAQELARDGYLVAAYTARGFGSSGGLVHLNDPEFEVADARAVITALAAHPDVQLDRPGDPRVGVSGVSYGGALALMAAGADARVDAVVAAATWNDLAAAFYPNHVAGQANSPAGLDPADVPGVLKRRWLSSFFTGAAGPDGRPGESPAPSGLTATPCGRFEPSLCALFLQATSTGGTPSAALLQELRRRSPAVGNGRVGAPTLLLQGMQDSLFGLDHADATARQIGAAGTPVAVRWFEGGHDGGASPAVSETLTPWFDRYLRGDPSQTRGEPTPLPAFTATAPAFRRGGDPRRIEAAAYPGADAHPGPEPHPGAESHPGAQAQPGPEAPTGGGGSPGGADGASGNDGTSGEISWIRLPFADQAGGSLLSPPGGDPAATVALPGLGGRAEGAAPAGAEASATTAPGSSGANPFGAAAYPLAALPGQSVAFDTLPLDRGITALGAPRVRLTVTSSAADATLFVSLWRVVAGTPSAPRRLVAPIRVPTRPGVPTSVEVSLPAGSYTMEQGSTWRVLVSATDSSFATPPDARVYQVALDGPDLALPVVPSALEAATPPDAEVRWVSGALAGALLVAAATALATWRRGRRRERSGWRHDLSEVPLAVEHLVKTYADGHRAVDDVSWAAHRGQVVGLLGPNGAGKTTTIRMIAGLIHPDSGEAYVHGRPLRPGSPALAGVGALIEGPGFLPHLTGRANLRAYWAATGRPLEEAHLEEALEVAALGDAIERPVRSYSHGMKQRLGIAQAMLGLPEVLILDEPTNGLDPPQIAAMRPILRRYAQTGRTVVVSSHLLAEVELTCTHVVVMHRGQVVTAGAVADLIDSSDTTVLELDGGTPAATQVADVMRRPAHGWRGRGRRLQGLRSVEVVPGTDPARLVVVADAPRAQVVEAVVSAGGKVLGVSGRRHLEEVFLGVIAAQDLEAGRTVRPR